MEADSRRHLNVRRVPRSDLVGGSAVVLVALVIGQASILGARGLSREPGFLFGDEGHSLFVASRLLQHATLYRDVAYVYGWLPVTLYVPAARLFGNTPVVYLEFLLFWSVIGLLLGYVVVRQAFPASMAAVVVVLGLLPVFLIPGSLLGGYISTFYIPLERVAVLSAVLIWRAPTERSLQRSAFLGGLVFLMQLLKFGPGIVLLAAIAALDALIIWIERPPLAIWVWVQAVSAMLIAFAVGECLFAGWAYLDLPRPIALDVLWPAYLRDAYPPWASRWPTWNGWRLLVAQYGNPVIGAILSGASGAIVLSRVRLDRSSSARFLLPPLFFLFGMFSFFRTVDHFRQFAWMFTIGAVPALSRWRFAQMAALLAWCPVLWVVVASVSHGPAPGSVVIQTPAGWRLRASAAESARIEGIRRALTVRPSTDARSPVLFYPSGSGFYVAYGFEPPGRTVWFFSHAVRPYEVGELASDFRRARAIVDCERHGFEDLPAPLRAIIVSRLASRVWSDDRCAVFRLAGPSL
jgi:hypothetical protein